MRLDYERLLPVLTSEPLTAASETEVDAPDRRDGRAYVLSEDLRLATEVALVTGRPLLLRGEPGSGKSSLAAFVARNLDYRYYEEVVTSATRAQDFLWRFDTVRRLADAQVRTATDPPLRDVDYVVPGALWWAFDRTSAVRRGAKSGEGGPRTPGVEPNASDNATRAGDGVVVLIDEIDKADPDVPNGLLGPLSSSSFTVHETGDEIRRPTRTVDDAVDDPLSHVLIVVTTNEERDLPPAFVRRCIVHVVKHPDTHRLVDIARLRFARPGEEFDEALSLALAERVHELRAQATEQGLRPPGTAEYLDALRACTLLRIGVSDGAAWDVLARATLIKQGASDDGLR